MRHLFFLLIIAILSSCGRIIIFEPEEQMESNPSHVVSIEKARDAVLNVLESIQTKNGNQRFIVEEYSVNTALLTKSAKTIALQDSIPPYFVFNFNNNGGYALAAADDRMCPILCVVDSGRFSIDTPLTNPGQIAMLSRIETQYRMILGLPIIDFEGRLLTVNDYGAPTSATLSLSLELMTSEVTPAGHWEIGPTEVVGYSGTLLSTTWDQGSPFNKYMYNSLGQQCPAGCTNIALTQVMNYHGRDVIFNGRYIDWDEVNTIKSTSVPGTATGREMLQRFLYDIAIDFNATMTPTGTTMDPSLIPDFLESLSYYSGGTESSYDMSTICMELNNNYPTLIEGYSQQTVHTVFGIPVYIEYDEGHEWVIDRDQLLRTKHIWVEANGYSSGTHDYYTYDRLFHCNFGWDGNYNGYYYTVPANYVGYQYNLSMITGIRPY